MAVDKDILIRLKIEKANAEKDLNDANQALSKLDKTSKEYEATLRRVASAEKVAQVAQKKLTKAMTEGKSAVGAGTSATLELGRVLSDMPYGIRGVANNLQQLASNLFFMSKATDTATGKALGFKGAIGTVIKGLAGPAGVLIAFQGVIALFDFFSGGAKKAEESADSFKNSLKELEKVLSTLFITQEEVNDKIEDYINLSALRIKTDKILKESANEIIEINAKVAEAERLVEVGRITGLKDMKSREDSLATLMAERTAIYQGAVDKVKALKASEDEFNASLEGSVKGLQKHISKLKKQQKAVSTTREEFLKLQPAIDEAQRALDKILGTKETGGGGLIKPIDLKEFEGDIFTVEDMLRKFAGQELIRNAQTAEDKKVARGIIELEGYKHDFEKFKENEDNKFAEFEKALEKKREAEIEKAKGNKARIIEINALFDENSLSAQEEYEAESTISYTEYIKGLKAIADKNKPDIIIGEVDPETEADRQKILQDKKTEHFNSMLEKYIGYTQDVKKVLGAIGDFMNSEFDRELVIEQNKTNALNNELNARLANENLSKDERQAIQDEIAQNDEKLRVKQEAIERKRFKMQKALDIGMAIMDTAAAMMRALVIFGPTPVGFAAAGVAAAFGAVQIAMIARQKFQTTASGSPRAAGGSNSGGSSGGSDRADPSFNIVGMSGNSQLLEAIQSQFDKPLQAYVVSREVTRQQNLDAAIQTGAGF